MRLQWLSTNLALSSNYMLSCNYVSLEKMEVFILVSLSCCAGGLYLIVLTLLTNLYSYTMKTFRTWRSHALKAPMDRLILKKIRKFALPFRIHFGTYYIIKPIRMIIFIHTLIWGTMRVLLTFPCKIHH